MRRAMMIGAGLLGLLLLAGCGWIYAQNVETPDYALVSRDNDIELRDYPEMLAAEVTRMGARRSAVSAGFRPLAGYIFAKEREGEKIAMTAPVTQSSADGKAWKVRFLMPSDYSAESLPAPGEGVEIVTVPPTRMAAIRFPGGMSDPLYVEKEQVLRSWITAEGLTPVGPPTFAYYNDPFTPGFLRRNEVMIPVE